MSPIHPETFRVGKTSRWSSDVWNNSKISALTEITIKNFLNGYLGDLYNLFVVKCGIVHNHKSGVVNLSFVFYKYIQKARVVKSRRMILLVAAGAFEAKSPLAYVRQSQGFTVPVSILVQLEIVLQSIFDKTFHISAFNISQLAEITLTKADRRVLQTLDQFLRTKGQSSVSSRGNRAVVGETRVESGWLNPIALRDNYRAYKAFSNLSYFLDLLMVVLYTSVYSTSDLLSDVIVRGLLRNMKRHKQFLSAIETTLSHFRSFENWPYKPFDWCIALHGKIGSGTVRSRSHYITTGFLPLQTVTFPVEYSYRQVDTKYGSIGVKVWLRRQIM